MSILSVFKKKDTAADLVAEKALAKKDSSKEKTKKKEPKEEKVKMDLAGYRDVKSNVLVRPVVTEKSSMMNADGRYVFEIADYATKQEVKTVVEKRYKVNVVRVNVVTVHPKKRMRGAIQGKVSGYRKAMVFLKSGETIDLSK